MTLQLLTPEDIAHRLQISTAAARALMRSLKHIRIGKLWRIEPAEFEKFLAKGGNAWAKQKTDCISEDACGGATGTTPQENAGPSPRTSEIAKRLSAPRVKSSAATRLTPRRGHGRNSRSK